MSAKFLGTVIGSLSKLVGTTHGNLTKINSKYIGVVTASASYADVSAAISASSPGDTIFIPAGEETWNTQLTLTASVYLRGAGIGNTIITPGVGSYPTTSQIYINLTPTTDNIYIRISGFTFNHTSYLFNYVNNSTTVDSTKVRIDHCNFNFNTSGQNYVLQRTGMAHGVMDNCTNTASSCIFFDIAGGASMWTTNNANMAYERGNASSFYFEDNVFDTYMTNAGNGSGRYVWRYNTLTPNIPGGLLLDQHGNTPAPQSSGFGGEVYGNLITSNANGFGMLEARGGKWFVFMNWLMGSNWSEGAKIWFVEETDDGDWAAGHAYGHVHPYNSQPYHISSSYVWNNRITSGQTLVPATMDGGAYGLTCSICEVHVPDANVHVWNHNTSYNGTSQIGVYSGASLPDHCTVGDGAWITSQGNSADLTNYVGAAPGTRTATTYIDGDFYTSTETDVWTLFYTPYTYPHPLRGEG